MRYELRRDRCLGVCGLLVLAACGGEASLGGGGGASGLGGQTGGGAVAGGTSGTSGVAVLRDGAAQGGTGGDMAGASLLDSGISTTVDGARATDSALPVDPRFRIIEPLAPPSEVYYGDVGERGHHTVLPTDEKIAGTSISFVSDDLSVVVGATTYSILQRATGNYWPARSKTFRWTEAQGTTAVGQADLSVDDSPLGMTSDASIVISSSTNAQGGNGFYRFAPTGSTWVDAVSNITDSRVGHDGSIISYATMSDTNYAVRWTPEGAWRPLLGNSSNDAIATSSKGDAILLVADRVLTTPHSFLWSQSTGAVGVGVLPGYSGCSAHGMNADGSVVIGNCLQSPPQSSALFRWTQATGIVELPVPRVGYQFLSPDTRPWLVSTNGVVCVGNGYAGAPGTEVVFRHDLQSGFVVLFGPQATEALEIVGMSDDGETVFANSAERGDLPPDFRALRWTKAASAIQLPDPDGYPSSRLNFVAHDGSVAGGASSLDPDTFDDSEAVIWDDKGPRIVAAELAAAGVNLGGLHLRRVSRVESASTLVIMGDGSYPRSAEAVPLEPNEERAWVARLPRR